VGKWGSKWIRGPHGACNLCKTHQVKAKAKSVMTKSRLILQLRAVFRQTLSISYRMSTVTWPH